MSMKSITLPVFCALFAISFNAAAAENTVNSFNVVNYSILLTESGPAAKTIPTIDELKKNYQLDPKIDYVFFHETKEATPRTDAPLLMEVRIKGFGFPADLVKKMRSDHIDLPYAPSGPFTIIDYSINEGTFNARGSSKYYAIRYGIPFPITKTQWEKYKDSLQTLYHFDDKNYGLGTAVPN